jgi:hypothetical protein
VGVAAIGSQGYTVVQLMQTVGERNVRIVPDVSVTGANAGNGLLDGMLGMLVHDQAAKAAVAKSD